MKNKDQMGTSVNEIKPLSMSHMNTLGEPDPSNISKQDILQSINFDQSGQYLAVGDRGGRVIVFQKFQEGKQVDYDYLTEFLSFETGYDTLTSQPIPEKVNVLQWVNVYSTVRPKLLTANDKTIKLFKIVEVKERSHESSVRLLKKGRLMIPRSKTIEENTEGKCALTFNNAHEQHINSVSVCKDGENFLSVDDFRANLWNLGSNKAVFSVIDFKSENAEEIITSSQFHPSCQNLMLYTTSKGYIHICDFRDQSTFQGRASISFLVGAGQKKNVFSDMINTVSCAKFFNYNRNYIGSRDYLSVKLWDIRKGQNKFSYGGHLDPAIQPVNSLQVNDLVEKNLVSLYEEDSYYDKFFMDISPCEKFFLTGSYNKQGHIIDIQGDNNLIINAMFSQKGGDPVGKIKKYSKNKKLKPMDGEKTDFKKKIEIGCWHPLENTVGLVYRNCIFLYTT